MDAKEIQYQYFIYYEYYACMLSVDFFEWMCKEQLLISEVQNKGFWHHIKIEHDVTLMSQNNKIKFKIISRQKFHLTKTLSPSISPMLYFELVPGNNT